MAKHPGGRPRQGEEVKLAPLNMRTTPELRAMIEEAADVNGRSLTQEVERRLISTFNEERWMGGPHIRNFVKMLGAVIDKIESDRGKRWIDDWPTWYAVEEATRRLLRWDRPPPPPEADRTKELHERHQEAVRARDEARKALEEFRASIPPAPAKSELTGLLGARLMAEPVDPRLHWTNEQRAQEMALIEKERDASDRERDAQLAMTELLASMRATYENARKSGEEEADAWFQLFGPNPRHGN